MVQHSEMGQALKEARYRLTKPRMAIVRVLERCEHGLSPEKVHQRAMGIHPALGLVTVYRTLALLTECHLLETIDIEKGYKLYEHVLGHRHHDHFICTKCGHIVEFSNDALEDLQNEISRKIDFRPISHSLKIYGVCSKCRQEQ